MSATSTVDYPSAGDGLDLDIRLIEVSAEAADLVTVTDDNCGSSCPHACTTSRG